MAADYAIRGQGGNRCSPVRVRVPLLPDALLAATSQEQALKNR